MLTLGIAAAVVTGYLLGNFNGAILISHYVLHDDVRKWGSGNAGLTNFFRSFGGVWTLVVLLIDVAKTAAACYFSALLLKWLGYGELWQTAKMIGGFAAVIGHAFPVFYRFHGGKGILCAGALALFMEPLIFVIVFAVFVLLFALTHYVSLGSVSGAACYPVAFWLFYPDNYVVLALALVTAVLAIVQHRANLLRLKNGTESKIYLKKK